MWMGELRTWDDAAPAVGEKREDGRPPL